jgi:hypothetical protein
LHRLFAIRRKQPFFVSHNASHIMSKHLQIAQTQQPEKTLSKEQKRFNTLVKKIETLRLEIEQTQELDLELRRVGEARVTPAERAAMAACRDWIMVLSNSPFRHRLNKKLAEKFALILLEEIGRLLDTSFYADDMELQALYAEYEDSGRSYEEIREEMEGDLKEMSARMMNDMFDMNLEADDLDDPERIQEKINAKQAEFEAAERTHAEKRAKKGKTDSQQAAESSVKKTAKQIYINLIRHFHPDKEPDEQRRLEKTEVMKQITAAYEADDHLRLLELQMTLLSDRNNVYADFDNPQLKYFNQTLQQQVAELERELFLASPEGNGNLYAMLYAPKRPWMLANVEQHIRHQKELVKNIQQNIKAVQMETVFREFVRSYELEDDFFPNM